MIIGTRDHGDATDNGGGQLVFGHDFSCVSGVDMPEFMADQGREFGFVVQVEQYAPGAGNGAAGKSIRIDIGRIDRKKPVGHFGSVGLGGHLFTNGLKVLLQLFILDHPKV